MAGSSFHLAAGGYDNQMAKKHHYVPVTYLNNFTDDLGYLLVYLKNEPLRPFRQKPEATAFERHYYSQVALDGARDTEGLEGLFSQVETYWPRIVSALSARKSTFPGMEQLIVFVALAKVRGPAFRDAAESLLAEHLNADLKRLVAMGEIPPSPVDIPDILDQVVITVDPQMSLWAMASAMSGVGELLETLCFEVLHNQTGFSFLTSDNPVIYYDPKFLHTNRLPYNIRGLDGPIEFLMPISRNMMLRGRRAPVRCGIRHRDIDDIRKIRGMNRLVAQYGYRSVFAPEQGWQDLITQNSATSPILKYDCVTIGSGELRLTSMGFGPRPSKPKWSQREDEPTGCL